MPIAHRLVAACVLLGALSSTASARIERTVEKTFQVKPGVHVRVSTSGGEIRVSPSAAPEVKIVARERFRTSSDAEADEQLKDLDLTLEQHGDEVVAVASYRSSGLHFGFWPPVEVDFIVTVPPSASTDLKTSGGDVVVGNLDGNLKAKTSGGGIKMGRMGGDIEASTSGGDVELEEGGGSSRLSTSGGNVSVGHAAGPCELRTSGGDIRVDTVSATLDADTSGGNVRAGFEGALKGDCTLSTSGGGVKATVGQNVGFHLDARTSGGDVNAAGLTITISGGGIGKSSLSGDVNGGGPLLKLRTSGGDIEVVSRKG